MSEITASVKAEDAKKEKAKKGNIDPSFNMDELRELADLVDAHELTEFEFENENIRVRISKMTAPVVQAVQPAAATHTSTQSTTHETAPSEFATGQPAVPDSDLFKITSPIVGTYYSASGPDKDAYVTIGSKVAPDTVVCIVEAMKLMNEIQAETTGEVTEIYVENGQPVEYGQPLFGVKK